MEHEWIHSSPADPVPSLAVIGGHDVDESPTYVGRSFHEGDMLPAQVIPSKGAYVCWDGSEVKKTNYGILIGEHYDWVPCASDAVPYNAVEAGKTRTGEPLYIGRGHWHDCLAVGKIHPSDHCLYIPFGGQEHRLDTYEVLVYERAHQWVAYERGYIPPDAVEAGHDTNGAAIYVGRATHEGEKLPVKVIPRKGGSLLSVGGYEISKFQYEVLTGQGYYWVKGQSGSMPSCAVLAGTTRDGEPIFIGRGHHNDSLTPGRINPSENCLYIPYGGLEHKLTSYEVLVSERPHQWVAGQKCDVPPNAVVAGSDTDGATIYVGRAMHEGGNLPEDTNEVLLTEHAHEWVACERGYIPPDAVEAGYDTDRAPIYVGRAMHEGENLPAKVIPNHNCLYVCYGGIEIPKDNFELLTGRDYCWVQAQDGSMPPGAVSTGTTRDGEPIFIGRGHHNDSLTPGRINPSENCLYIPYGGLEHKLTSYEVLVSERPHQWVAGQKCDVPPNAVVAGSDTDGATIYVGRAMHEGGNLPEDTNEVLLTEHAHEWVACERGYIPPDAVEAGYDTNGAAIYVGRATHEGEKLPVKVIPRKGGSLLSVGGYEISKFQYEVLTGQGYYWVKGQSGSMPSCAVLAGTTRDGEPIFIGRGHHNDSLTPGRINPSENCLYIPYGGLEHKLTSYEVLVSERPHQWVAGQKCDVPPNAVVAGSDTDGATIYVGRAMHEGGNLPEDTNEVLLTEHAHEWVACERGYIPPDAVEAGYDTDRAPIYVGRAMHEGENLPAKVIPSHNCPYVCYGGIEIPKSNFELLTGRDYCWVQAHDGSMPPGAVSTGTTRDGEPIFIGRGHHNDSLTPGRINPSENCLYIPYGGLEHKLTSYEVLVSERPHQWVAGQKCDVPPNAVVAGNDTDGATIYVGRAMHEGGNLPVKVMPSKGSTYVGFGGYEIFKPRFEVLIGEGYHWVSPENGSMPPGAVSTGRTRDGELVFIGRGRFCGSLTPGRVHPSQNCVYIPFEGEEHKVQSYEVLVRDK